MKRLLPGKVEMAIFGTLALLCAAIASSVAAQDLALAALGMPIFLAASVMGLRRNPKYAPLRQDVPRPVEKASLDA